MGGYSILQARHLSSQPSQLVRGPRYCRIWTFPLKTHYECEKLSQNRERGHRIWTHTEGVLTFQDPTSVQNVIKIEQKLRNVGARTDRQTDRQTDRRMQVVL